MPGCEALNASATCSSTATCSGASPVPRQQYQRISTSPGLAGRAGAGDGGDAGCRRAGRGALRGGRRRRTPKPPRRAAEADGLGLVLRAAGRGDQDDGRDEGAEAPELLVHLAPPTWWPWAAARLAIASSPSSSSSPSASRPARPDDDAFHVVARPIAADVSPPEFDRRAVGGRRDALDEQRRRARRALEQARLAGAQQDGLERLAGLGDADAVALGQQVVQRAALEVRGQQAREPLGRQVDLLEQEGLAVGEAQALEVERRRPGSSPSAGGDRLPRGLGPGGDQAGLGIEAAGLHLLGEAQGAGEVDVDPRREDERAAAAGPLEPLLADELAQRARTVIRLQP